MQYSLLTEHSSSSSSSQTYPSWQYLHLKNQWDMQFLTMFK